MPYFSIIIPSFNRAHILKRAIQGILEQIFRDFEIIIVDDGSTDNTWNTISKFKDHPNIKIFHINKSTY